MNTHHFGAPKVLHRWDVVGRCTVIVGAPMVRCGAPAVTSFCARNGDRLHECADHAYQALT